MRKMKDSGIEWIGEIPEHWNVTTIGMLFNGKAGGDAKPDLYSDEKDEKHPYPVYTNTMDKEQVYAYTSSPVFEGNTITVTGRGDIGRAFYRTTPYDAIIRLLSLSPRTELSCPFYTYWINVVPFFTDNAAVGQLSAAQIKSYKSISIPLPEQQKIAAYLDTQCAHIDSVIEKTKQSIEEYKKLKQAVITQAVTKGVRGKREMKDSGVEWIGDIPKEWNLIKITRLLDETHPYPIGDGDHGLIKTEDYKSEGIPYLRVQNLGWGTPLLLDNVVYISEERNEQIKNSILRPNDILFAKTGATIGKTGIIPEDLPISNTTSHIGKITLSKKYCSKFVFHVLSSIIGYRQFWEIALQKTTRPELSIEETKSIKILMPDTIEEQEEIAVYLDEKCSEIDSIITKKEKFLTELENYKKSMIYEYVTGKKEVL